MVRIALMSPIGVLRVATLSLPDAREPTRALPVRPPAPVPHARDPTPDPGVDHILIDIVATEEITRSHAQEVRDRGEEVVIEGLRRTVMNGSPVTTVAAVITSHAPDIETTPGLQCLRGDDTLGTERTHRLVLVSGFSG